MLSLKALLTEGLLLAAGPLPAQAPQRDAVILITLDGARIEEIFGGMDEPIFRSTLKGAHKLDELEIYKRFRGDTREERRQRLMPFFWQLVTEHGSIAGDRALGSIVRLRNRHRFSYPGYAEILTGEPHDEAIASNDPVQSPFTTVLEGIRAELGLPAAKVATFGSWGVFNAIAERERGATFVNAGVEDVDSADVDVVRLNALQREANTPWDGTRFDAFTFRLAMQHLASARPRVLYLAFDETDDWAHDGRYDRLLDAYARTDGYLRTLWTWLQNEPDYRGRTHLLITTDHGRGRTPQDWRSHGAKVEGAEDVWMAFVSPRMARRGAWRGGPELTTSQAAATLASWVGVDWKAAHPGAGSPVDASTPAVPPDR